MNWSDTASGKNDFYSDYKIKQMYKAHLRTFTSRVNTINGRKYSEDPTIYYWNLLNEPRWCAGRACKLAGPPHAACLGCLRVHCWAGKLTMLVWLCVVQAALLDSNICFPCNVLACVEGHERNEGECIMSLCAQDGLLSSRLGVQNRMADTED